MYYMPMEIAASRLRWSKPIGASPTGPTPGDEPDKDGTTYDPSTAQTFSFSLTGFAENEYYEIGVTLARSNYAGYAANFGRNTYKDLAFLESDYVQTTTVNERT